MPTTQNATGSHYEICHDEHHGDCIVTVTYWNDDNGAAQMHRVHNGDATGSHYIAFDGGDPLGRFAIRCACGYTATYFSYIAAARSMDLHLGDTFVPVQQRKVTAEQVSA